MTIFQEFTDTIENNEQRQRFIEIVEWISNHFPQLETKIAWNQPMFTDHDTFIIAFSISKQHIGVSPETAGMEAFHDEIKQAGYTQTSNLFRIKWQEEVNYDLLKKIIEFNIDDKRGCQTFWRKP